MSQKSTEPSPQEIIHLEDSDLRQVAGGTTEAEHEELLRESMQKDKEFDINGTV